RVSCADVDHPCGWRVGILLAADAGHVLAGQPGDGVSAGLGILLRLGLPSEQLRVVVARPCRIGARQVDPRRLIHAESLRACHTATFCTPALPFLVARGGTL